MKEEDDVVSFASAPKLTKAGLATCFPKLSTCPEPVVVVAPNSFEPPKPVEAVEAPSKKPPVVPLAAPKAALAAVVEPKIPLVAGVVVVCCPKPPVVVVEPERLKPEPNGFAAPSGDCVVACVLPKIDVVAAAG